MKYKLLVLDLDGTLTNKKKEVTEHTRRTLIEAQKRGVKIVLASGRPTYGVAPLAEILELQKDEGYILSYNGGEIIDWKTGEMMYENVLDPDILPYLYKCATDNHFAIVTYEDVYKRQGYGRKLINHLINHYSKEYTQMIVGTGDVPGVLAFYKSCGFEYSHCIKGFFTENYDHPIIDNGVLLKDMIYLKRKIGF